MKNCSKFQFFFARNSKKIVLGKADKPSAEEHCYPDECNPCEIVMFTNSNFTGQKAEFTEGRYEQDAFESYLDAAKSLHVSIGFISYHISLNFI